MPRSLSVSKAARMVSALTPENAEELVKFAQIHTSREIDHEVARLHPRGQKVRDRLKPVSSDHAELNCTVSLEVSRKLKKAQALLSTKLSRSVDFNETLS